MRRKKRDFAAEVAAMEKKIKNAEKRVKDLKGKLKEIINDRDMEVHQALAAAMKEKNLNINDVLKLVEDSPAGEAPETEKPEKRTRKKRK